MKRRGFIAALFAIPIASSVTAKEEPEPMEFNSLPKIELCGDDFFANELWDMKMLRRSMETQRKKAERFFKGV